MLKELISKTINTMSIGIGCANASFDEVYIDFTDGTAVRFYHLTDYGEIVSLVKIDGNIASINSGPLTDVFVREFTFDEDNIPDQFLQYNWDWDFSNSVYEFVFKNAWSTLTLVWIGSSNGYYSTDVHYGYTHNRNNL